MPRKVKTAASDSPNSKGKKPRPKRPRVRAHKGPAEPVVDRKSRPNNITDAEANQMFTYYCRVRNDGGLKRVARAFQRAERSVRRLAKRDDWAARSIRVKEKVDKHAETVAAQEQISSLVLTRRVLDKTFQSIDKRAIKTFRPTVSDYVRVADLYDRQGGGMLDNGGQQRADPEQVAEAIAQLNSLGKDLIGKLADLVVRFKPAKAAQPVIPTQTDNPVIPTQPTESQPTEQQQGGNDGLPG